MRRERLLALVIALCITATAITFPAIADESVEAVTEQVFYVNDFSKSRLHHEIYLSDARKVEPEKWKTVIRHPIKKV